MRPIADVAADLGVADELIPYGHTKGKLPLSILDRGTPDGKLVLVTAITPTPAGEGKTTTSIGLVQAMAKRGHKVVAALREPSLGPCFGIKGGGTGGGNSRLEPSVDINLHFNGDLHAVTAAHNLIAALLDNHLHYRKEPAVDPRRVVWKRCLDQNDRSLRNVMVGLGGGTQGLPRESGFDITAASEVMAILCLASGVDDLRTRLARTVVGYGPDGEPVTVDDIGATGGALALLKDAMLPNLVQTTEGVPALVHGGPFANIAHGCNSILATRMGLTLADWTVTEAGFASDLGAEKFFHIACRAGGFAPHAVVLVATVRALKHHGGAHKDRLDQPDVARVLAGMDNLWAHVDNLQAFGVPLLVAINRFPTDTQDELSAVLDALDTRGIPGIVASHFSDGGDGALDLADAVVAAATKGEASFTPAYEPSMSLEEKLRAMVRRVYGADDVQLDPACRPVLKRLERMGLGHLPVCMAKTQNSISADPSKRGRPTGFVVPVRQLQLSVGAGFVVALAGDILRMPGLPRNPSADQVDVVDGEIIGIA